MNNWLSERSKLFAKYAENMPQTTESPLRSVLAEHTKVQKHEENFSVK